MGTYSWTAGYSGDANNNGATSTCSSETVVVSRNVTTIGTSLQSGDSSGAMLTVVLVNGQASVSDSASLSGLAAGAAGTVTYTVVLKNTGTATQADNPGHEFTDVLPAGLSLVSASASSGRGSDW